MCFNQVEIVQSLLFRCNAVSEFGTFMSQLLRFQRLCIAEFHGSVTVSIPRCTVGNRCCVNPFLIQTTWRWRSVYSCCSRTSSLVVFIKVLWWFVMGAQCAAVNSGWCCRQATHTARSFWCCIRSAISTTALKMPAQTLTHLHTHSRKFSCNRQTYVMHTKTVKP